VTAALAVDDGTPAPPRWHLALPVGVIVLAAVLTPAAEFRANQGDIGLYLEKAAALLAGQVPYRDFPFEYPPLALVPMVVPALLWPFGTLTLETYPWLFAAWEAVLVLGVGSLLARIVRLPGGPSGTGRPRSVAVRLTIVSIGAALALTWRFDLFPAVLVMVALWASLDGRPGAAGIALGMGVLAKLYPLALVPALAVPWLLPLDRGRLARYGLATAATVVLGMLPFVALAGTDALAFLSYQSQRGLQVESVGGGLAVLGGLLGGQPVAMSYGFSAVQVEGGFARAWLAALPAVTVIGFGLLGLVGLRRLRAERAALGRVQAATIVTLAFASVLVLLVTSKVFSIQYVVWIVPFAAMLRGRRFWLAAAALALTMPIHPLLYHDLVEQQALAILVLNLRNALVLALTAWVIWHLHGTIGRRAGEGSVARPAGLEPTTFRSAT
jgi:uncharacterized membrane protein